MYVMKMRSENRANNTKNKSMFRISNDYETIDLSKPSREKMETAFQHADQKMYQQKKEYYQYSQSHE